MGLAFGGNPHTARMLQDATTLSRPVRVIFNMANSSAFWVKLP
jgi:predicted fused transcriptional regulator/phosphomethylpyrimidine kinase